MGILELGLLTVTGFFAGYGLACAETHREKMRKRRRRETWLADFAAEHLRLRENDPEGWAALQAERREFDGTLMDGLRDQ